VLTGPSTGVKEQVVGRYAEPLTAAGLTTVAFDHRGFGDSGGRRGHEGSQGKLADLRAAVDLLAARDEVDADRIGIVGICLGGGYAVRGPTPTTAPNGPRHPAGRTGSPSARSTA
jgi:uncharacterized protein